MDMDRLGIIGASWKRCGTAGLEPLTIAKEQQPEQLPELRRSLGVDELVYLATCNRVEVLFAHGGTVPLTEIRRRLFVTLMGRSPDTGEAERLLRMWGGEGALEHLLLVASGLDSAQLGEREIRGQLRGEFELARDLGLTGPRLDWAVREALRVARKVSQQTALAEGRTSLAEIGLESFREALEHIGVAASSGLPVALLGVSPMTERCGARLRSDGWELLVVNRSAERGGKLAEFLGARFLGLSEFRQEPPRVAGVLCATGASVAVLQHDVLARLADQDPKPVLVDFGIPADIDHRAAETLRLPLYSMQHISQRAEGDRVQRLAESAEAREVVDAALDELRRKVAEETTSATMAALHRMYHSTVNDRLEHLFRKDLRHLGDAERDAIERFGRNLAQRFAHVPRRGLRALAAECGPEAVDVFLAASDRELAEGVRDASQEKLAGGRQAAPETVAKP
ncbi:MAG: hypothetical protein MPN21_05125 [Thermoanaerobaculia bacterium]|nr:hypothetical protein [Thermoanaerobaculia bacterium]